MCFCYLDVTFSNFYTDDFSDKYSVCKCFFFITVPTAEILGGPDLHVDKGSTINLTCSIKFSPEPPAYIFWYHHDDVSLLHYLA